MLFDLELSEVLLGGAGTDSTCEQKLVPIYLKEIFNKNEDHSNLAKVQTHIRELCLTEMVDRLLYSARNLRFVQYPSRVVNLLYVFYVCYLLLQTCCT